MILVECKPDEILARLMFNEEVFHGKCKSAIIIKLAKTPNLKGMVDEDPGKPVPTEFKQFKLVKNNDYLGLKIYSHNNNSVIYSLVPRLEEWILRISKLAKIDPLKFGLPNKSDMLRKMINSKLDKFELLVRELERTKIWLEIERFVKSFSD